MVGSTWHHGMAYIQLEDYLVTGPHVLQLNATNIVQVGLSPPRLTVLVPEAILVISVICVTTVTMVTTVTSDTTVTMVTVTMVTVAMVSVTMVTGRHCVN